MVGVNNALHRYLAQPKSKAPEKSTFHQDPMCFDISDDDSSDESVSQVSRQSDVNLTDIQMGQYPKIPE